MTTKTVIPMDGPHGETGGELRPQDGGNQILLIEEGTLLEEIEAARGDGNDALGHTGVDEELAKALGRALRASRTSVTGNGELAALARAA